MINKLKDIDPSLLENLINIGLQSINYNNLENRIFTKEDIARMVSHDGFSVTIEFDGVSTVASITDIVYDWTQDERLSKYLRMLDSPLAAQFQYHVYIQNEANLVLFCGDKKSFKNTIVNKIFFYDQDFKLHYINEAFHLTNHYCANYRMSEFFIGYDFDCDYNPIGKLVLGNERGDYKTIDEKYSAKVSYYQNGFNIKEENLFLKHYILMDELENFDEVFTQFNGPLIKPFDVALADQQLEVAQMILFNK